MFVFSAAISVVCLVRMMYALYYDTKRSCISALIRLKIKIMYLATEDSSIVRQLP